MKFRVKNCSGMGPGGGGGGTVGAILDSVVPFTEGGIKGENGGIPACYGLAMDRKW